MPAAPASLGRLPALDTDDLPCLPGDWDRWLADDELNDALPGDPGLPGDAWLLSDPRADDRPLTTCWTMTRGWPTIRAGRAAPSQRCGRC